MTCLMTIPIASDETSFAAKSKIQDLGYHESQLLCTNTMLVSNPSSQATYEQVCFSCSCFMKAERGFFAYKRPDPPADSKVEVDINSDPLIQVGNIYSIPMISFLAFYYQENGEQSGIVVGNPFATKQQSTGIPANPFATRSV